MMRRLTAFWIEDKSLSILLILLVMEIFVIAPLSGINNFFFHIITVIIFSLFFLAGFITVAKRLLIRWFLFCLIAAAVIVRWQVLIAPSRNLLVADSFLTLCAAIFFTAAVLRKVYVDDGSVSAHRVRGAIAAYLLFGYLFAAAYRLLNYALPGSLALNPALAEPGQDLTDVFMYFSVVTLTTVGFGDVTAVHPLARSLVMLEGAIGTLYPAILIARLVSLQIEHEKR